MCYFMVLAQNFFFFWSEKNYAKPDRTLGNLVEEPSHAVTDTHIKLYRYSHPHSQCSTLSNMLCKLSIILPHT
jgi:hypothetical protein